MRTTIEYKESTRYNLQLQDVDTRTNYKPEDSLIKSSFYDFAHNHDTAFAGYVTGTRSQFAESMFNIVLDE